ncbi:hypothetical protein [Actinomadura parmotrematis]|uniref:Uncharacterized protein n=1 Tax=Actinomadura parmotrematis TaxID=2864039 RepID=A0ABS7FUE2_9ACTN|nr:hypothetical protein [Actinomadura parmotrematis]MBW8484027.1 hypothetical protein [Actinomadura parmotrematis]
MARAGPGAGPDTGADAARLLTALRDLAAARGAPGRDLAARPRVHWLAELPHEVYVEADAGPGDVLFGVPVIPASPPAAEEDLGGWLALRHWYRTLRDLAALRGADTVLATGLLTRRPVHDHLLTTPVRIEVDARTERVDVVLTGPAVLRDRELVAGLPGFRTDRTDWLREAVQAGQGFGLNASAADVLRKWGAVAGEGESVAFREDWAPEDPAAGPPRIRLAPALVVRGPDRAHLAGHYDRMIAQGRVPAGFARLVAPGGRSPVLHVEDGTAAVVTNLLARGARVLVATGDASAAAALHDALPAGIATLVALPGTADRAAATFRAARLGPGTLRDLAAREAAAARRVAELREPLPAGPVAPAAHAWIPPRAGLPARPPLTAAEAAELPRAADDRSPDRTGHLDVDPASLPSARYVRSLVRSEASAAGRAARADTEIARRLRRCDPALLERLGRDAAAVDGVLRELGLTGHPGSWNLVDHAVRAFTDALARRRPGVWARIADLTPQVEWADEALDAIAGREVTIPPGADARRLASAAEDLRRHLSAAASGKRATRRSGSHRQAERLLLAVRVDGQPLSTPERMEAAYAHLSVLLICAELQRAWEDADVSFPAGVPLEDRITRFRRAHARLARIRAILPAIEDVGELLTGSGIPITHPLQWYGFSAALAAVVDAREAERAAIDLAALRDAVPASPHDPPELHAARAAIEARDPDAYARALADLGTARRLRARQLRRAELLDRIRDVHPELAALLRTPDPAWPDRLAHWEEAWALAAGPAHGAADAGAREALAEAEEVHRAAAAELTAARAWAAALDRPDPAPSWIAPLWQIPDLLPPDPDSFDAVVVDGDHGAGAEGLFLLWLAPRVILTGAPGPDLPPPAGRLPGPLPVSATASLFTVLLERFPASPAPRADAWSSPADGTAVPPAPVRVAFDENPGQAPAPRPAPRPRPRPRAEAGPPPPAQSRSIAAYKRPELVAAVAAVLAERPGLDDDAVVDAARERLGIPADEALLASARLRFALNTHREG